MTLANKITLARIASAPFIFIVYWITIVKGLAPAAGIIAVWALFLVTESSDLLDGYIARKRGEVSDIGKLLDPFADVICRITYFSLFLAVGLMPVWALVIILYREFTINMLRMLLVRRGIAMGARPGGKIKSVLYFSASVIGLLTQSVLIFSPDLPGLGLFRTAAWIGFAVSAAAALASLADYVVVAARHLKGEPGGHG